MADESADDRWTVRGVPKAVRDAAADSAQRRKVTVGAWLCQAVDREIKAEHEPWNFTLSTAADKTSDMADAEARLALTERAVAAAVALANAPDVPAGFRRRANRLLREGLPPPESRTVSVEPRLLLTNGSPVKNGRHHGATAQG